MNITYVEMHGEGGPSRVELYRDGEEKPLMVMVCGNGGVFINPLRQRGLEIHFPGGASLIWKVTHGNPRWIWWEAADAGGSFAHFEPEGRVESFAMPTRSRVVYTREGILRVEHEVVES